MKAALLRDGHFEIEEIADPVPKPGQVLVRPIACGICGSDLNTVKHSARRKAYKSDILVDDLQCCKPLMLGHEFCCEVMESRRGSHLRAGTHVVSFPCLMDSDGAHLIGGSDRYHAGFCEQMLLSDEWLLEVPNGLSPEHASLTEPLSVGQHAVNRSGIDVGNVAMVIGCGPVGLAIVAALKAGGFGPVIATDPSPERRLLAECMGADVVIDPAVESPHEQWSLNGIAPQADTMIAAYAVRETFAQAIIFECTGVPGMVQAIMGNAPLGARIICVGICGGEDRTLPSIGIYKEIEVRYSLGYTHDEFALTLQRIAEGVIDVQPFVTGYAGRDNLNEAVEALKTGSHTKILIKSGSIGFQQYSRPSAPVGPGCR